ncbi:MAG: glycosyltransferase family 2 protein [Mycobacterium sp.]
MSDPPALSAADGLWQPTITAVITTYQRSAQVRQAIRSACTQSYAPLEVIVVEDGSESGLPQWLSVEGYGGVRYLRHDRNRGLAAARNTGLAAAAGEYIAYLDDDDEWKPERFARQVDRLRALAPEHRPKIAVVGCAVEVHDPARRTVRVIEQLNEGDLRASIVARRRLRTLPSSYLFRTETLRALGGFDEALPSSIDHDLWMSLAASGGHALTLRDALVVTYASGRRLQMTTDTPRRIVGVRAFIDKWQPVWEVWIGEREGQRFAHRYFAHAVGRLARHELALGRVGAAMTCLWTILRFKGRILVNIGSLVGLARFGGTEGGATLMPGPAAPDRAGPGGSHLMDEQTESRDA